MADSKIDPALNTVAVYARHTSEVAELSAVLEEAGFETEPAPAMRHRSVFHFTGRANRSSAVVITPSANPYDIFAHLAESEIGNPFLVWDPEKVKEIYIDLGKLKRIVQEGGGFDSLEPEQKDEYHRLNAQLNEQRKPIILYGDDAAWKGLNDVLDHMAASGVARHGFKDSITHAHTPEEVLAIMEARLPKDLSAIMPADHKVHVYLGANPVQVFEAEQDERERPRVTISYFGSATSKNEDHLATASRTVEMHKRNGWGLVNGGGTMAVMGVQLAEAKDADVYTHGISAHERGAVGLNASEKDPAKIVSLVSKYSDHKDMIHRIEDYLVHSEGIACLDGGVGSAQEVFMVLELFREGHKATKYQDVQGAWHDKPYVLIDENGTLGPMIEWAKKEHGEDYVKALHVVGSVREAENIFKEQFKAHPPKLATEIIDSKIDDAREKLEAAGIPADKIAPSEVAYGRPKTIENWQGTMSTVDLTLLKEDAKKDDIFALVQNAVGQEARSVCVRPHMAGYAKGLIDKAKEKDDSIEVMVVTVVNFPNGDMTVANAVKAMQDASEKGVDEIDIVMPKQMFKDGDAKGTYEYLKRAIGSVTVPVKVIIESAELTPEQIAEASLISKAAGASFVKTSTGYSKQGGADVEAVEIMRRAVGDDVGVKASGGVKTFEQAMAMIEAGADVIGASGLSIKSEAQRKIPEQRMNAENISMLPPYAIRGKTAGTVGY